MKPINRNCIVGLGFATATLMATSVSAALEFSTPEQLSSGDGAAKTKLVRMGNGWLVSVFGDSAGPSVYDTKADAIRPARDIFARACNTNGSPTQCADESEWTDSVNLSNTAGQTSIATNWDGVDGVEDFYGDSDKPNIFVAGSFAVVTWVDKYCGTANNQRMVSYIERGGVTVPFSCVYVSYTNNVGLGNWTTERLTDGTRDAKSDSNKGLSIGTPAVGNWVISWQEDPHGLQLGGAEGPGDGASGAAVTHGTDVWYTFTQDLMGESPWSAPYRISDNYTSNGSGGNSNPVFHPDDLENELTNLERGTTGAARPNLMLVGGSTPPTAVIAYEESKGSDKTDSGKFIRYHNFAFNSPPEPSGELANGEPGCIISDPLENSRRVRFVAQPTASTNGLRMGVFWRQGLPTEGGPADIMARVGTTDNGTGLSPEDMSPAVDPSCRTSDYAIASTLTNEQGNNLSSNTVPWSPLSCDVVPPLDPDNNLSHTTSYNPYEDSRAHRGAIVGDDLFVGFSLAKDWALATYTDLDNYNFWVRKYNVVAGDWTDATNVTNISNVAINVKEPRLVKTPGTGSGCKDPLNITNPEDCQDKSTFIVAWGTESNVYSHVEPSEELEIFYTRTRDSGDSYEAPVIVPDRGINNRFESQLRPSPAGNIVYSVWNERDGSGTHAKLSVSDESGTEPPPPANTLSLESFSALSRASVNRIVNVYYTVANDSAALEATTGSLVITGTDGSSKEIQLPAVAPGSSFSGRSYVYAPSEPQVVTWTATLVVDGHEVDSASDDTNVISR